MKRLFFYSVQGRMMAILLLFMSLLLAASWLTMRNMSQDIMEKEKGQKLIVTAAMLDFGLGDRDYDDILREHDAIDATREEKISILNSELADLGEALVKTHPGLGIGYYSRELDAILTYSPISEYGDRVGAAIAEDHPGRIVMITNQEMVRAGTMVRGNILNAMHPISRNGRVIGYAWANELTNSIEEQYQTTANSLLGMMITLYVLAMAFATFLSRRSMRDINGIVRGVRELRYDLTRKIPKASGDLGEVVDSINAMAEGIIKADQEREARLLAEIATQAQRDFLSRMSHEIRTPMNGVLGMTRLAQNAPTEAQRMEYLGKIHASASLLLGIINDILDFSKIEAGKMDIEMRPFNMTEVIENIRDLITPRIEEKNLRFVMQIDPSVPAMAVGDDLRLSQTLLNLLGNAVKFTLEGSITLKMSARILMDDKLRLDVSVRDTGIGMDADRQKDIFMAFIQANSSTARKFGGTGLGLSISKALVELMGGEISVTSQPGEGSEFSFFIIIEQYDGEVVGESTEERIIMDKRYDEKRLLVVEDNEINQEIAKAVLAEMGFTVDLANDGVEGVAAFETGQFDLIFMDIRMPIMDGLGATRAIREIEQKRGTGARIPIIAMTANAMQEDRTMSREAGMDAHVSKPLDLREIRQALYRYLSDEP